METEVLARKKAVKQPDPVRTPVGINIKGDPVWREWVELYAESKRTTVAGLLDRLLAEAAEADGFKPPPKRLP